MWKRWNEIAGSWAWSFRQTWFQGDCLKDWNWRLVLMFLEGDGKYLFKGICLNAPYTCQFINWFTLLKRWLLHQVCIFQQVELKSPCWLAGGRSRSTGMSSIFDTAVPLLVALPPLPCLRIAVAVRHVDTEHASIRRENQEWILVWKDCRFRCGAESKFLS